MTRPSLLATALLCLSFLCAGIAPGTARADASATTGGATLGDTPTRDDAPAPDNASPARSTHHLRSQLVAETTQAVAGQTLRLGLLLDHDPHWHTYWRNPGDSGLATKVQLTLPAGVRDLGLDWPAPYRFLISDLVNFGYGGRQLLPIRIAIPAGHKADPLDITLRASWLICEIECIPGQADYALRLPLLPAGSATTPDPRWQADFARAAARQPQPLAGAESRLQAQADGRFLLQLRAANLPEGLNDWQLFPVTEQLVAYGPAPDWQQQADGSWQTMLARSDYFAALPEESEWLLVQGDTALHFQSRNDAAGQVPVAGANAAADADPAGPEADAGADRPGSDHSKQTGPAPSGDTVTLLPALLFALLGGLVLNLMPCVFPVLSLKAMAAVSAADDRPALRAHGLWYSAGVVLSFIAVAGLLLALRAGGEQLGWGFQMQEPAFIAAIVLLLFAMALSFSGVWELSGRLTGLGQTLTEGQGARAAFFTGVLAVIVASPCTAPFMGTALGFAIAQPWPAALAVFVALGLGLALPMLLLGFVPALARLLPRPGAWMQRFRQILAFPLYLTVIWLLWVYGEQTSALGMAWLLAALCALAFGLWLWHERRQLRRAGARRVATLAALLALATGLILPFTGDTPRLSSAERMGSGDGQSWSPARLADLRARGEPVLINMTAAWCLTCLANERLALSDAGVRADLQARGITIPERRLDTLRRRHHPLSGTARPLRRTALRALSARHRCRPRAAAAADAGPAARRLCRRRAAGGRARSARGAIIVSGLVLSCRAGWIQQPDHSPVVSRSHHAVRPQGVRT